MAQERNTRFRFEAISQLPDIADQIRELVRLESELTKAVTTGFLNQTQSLIRYQERVRQVEEDKKRSTAATREQAAAAQAAAAVEVQALQGVQTKIQQLTQARMQSGVQLAAQAKDIQAANKSVESSYGALADTIKATFAAYSAGEAIRFIFNAQAEVKNFDTALRQMTSSNYERIKVQADLIELAKKSPFTVQEINQYAKQLIAVGVEASNTTKVITQLGNAAAVLGGPDVLGRLVYVYGQVQAAGKLTSQDLRQFTETGFPLITQLSEMLGKQQKDVRAMITDGAISAEMVNKAIELLTTGAGRFAGLMQSATTTVVGQFSMLKDRAFLMAAQVGDSLSGMATGVIKVFGGLLDILGGTAERMETTLTVLKAYAAAWTISKVALNGYAVAQGLVSSVMGTLSNLKTTYNVILGRETDATRAIIAASREEQVAKARAILTTIEGNIVRQQEIMSMIKLQQETTLNNTKITESTRTKNLNTLSTQEARAATELSRLETQRATAATDVNTLSTSGATRATLTWGVALRGLMAAFGWIALLYTAGTLIYDYVKGLDKASNTTKEFIEANDTEVQSLRKLNVTMEGSVKFAMSLADGTKAKTVAVQQLQREYPEYYRALDKEKDLNGQLRVALDAATASLRKKIELMIEEKRLNNIRGGQVEAINEEQRVTKILTEEYKLQENQLRNNVKVLALAQKTRDAKKTDFFVFDAVARSAELLGLETEAVLLEKLAKSRAKYTALEKEGLKSEAEGLKKRTEIGESEIKLLEARYKAGKKAKSDDVISEEEYLKQRNKLSVEYFSKDDAAYTASLKVKEGKTTAHKKAEIQVSKDTLATLAKMNADGRDNENKAINAQFDADVERLKKRKLNQIQFDKEYLELGKKRAIDLEAIDKKYDQLAAQKKKNEELLKDEEAADKKLLEAQSAYYRSLRVMDGLSKKQILEDEIAHQELVVRETKESLGEKSLYYKLENAKLLTLRTQYNTEVVREEQKATRESEAENKKREDIVRKHQESANAIVQYYTNLQQGMTTREQIKSNNDLITKLNERFTFLINSGQAEILLAENIAKIIREIENKNTQLTVKTKTEERDAKIRLANEALAVISQSLQQQQQTIQEFTSYARESYKNYYQSIINDEKRSYEERKKALNDYAESEKALLVTNKISSNANVLSTITDQTKIFLAKQAEAQKLADDGTIGQTAATAIKIAAFVSSVAQVQNAATQAKLKDELDAIDKKMAALKRAYDFEELIAKESYEKQRKALVESYEDRLAKAKGNTEEQARIFSEMERDRIAKAKATAAEEAQIDNELYKEKLAKAKATAAEEAQVGAEKYREKIAKARATADEEAQIDAEKYREQIAKAKGNLTEQARIRSEYEKDRLEKEKANSDEEARIRSKYEKDKLIKAKANADEEARIRSEMEKEKLSITKDNAEEEAKIKADMVAKAKANADEETKIKAEMEAALTGLDKKYQDGRTDREKVYNEEVKKLQRQQWEIQKKSTLANLRAQQISAAASAFGALASIPIVGIPLGIAAAAIVALYMQGNIDEIKNIPNPYKKGTVRLKPEDLKHRGRTGGGIIEAHADERIVEKEQNDKIGDDISNKKLGQIVTAYKVAKKEYGMDFTDIEAVRMQILNSAPKLNVQPQYVYNASVSNELNLNLSRMEKLQQQTNLHLEALKNKETYTEQRDMRGWKLFKINNNSRAESRNNRKSW